MSLQRGICLLCRKLRGLCYLFYLFRSCTQLVHGCFCYLLDSLLH
uniref:Uncharacterized protein n=1 Tax=Anguilla anguilla TaxID=7936 RepID=A0A0E9WSH0_ANGAN